MEHRSKIVNVKTLVLTSQFILKYNLLGTEKFSLLIYQQDFKVAIKILRTHTAKMTCPNS